jgi:hypothetical protein
MAADPISRLEVVRSEIDRVFGDGHAAAHWSPPSWQPRRPIGPRSLIARSLQDIAAALLVEDEPAPGRNQLASCVRTKCYTHDHERSDYRYRPRTFGYARRHADRRGRHGAVGNAATMMSADRLEVSV